MDAQTLAVVLSGVAQTIACSQYGPVGYYAPPPPYGYAPPAYYGYGPPPGPPPGPVAPPIAPYQGGGYYDQGRYTGVRYR